MEAMRRVRRLAVVAAVAVVMFMSHGCAVVRYVQYRGEDCLEMVDFGFTVTPKPHIGLYWNSLDALVFRFEPVEPFQVVDRPVRVCGEVLRRHCRLAEQFAALFIVFGLLERIVVEAKELLPAAGSVEG